MTDDSSIRSQGSARNTFYGKCLLVAIAACLIGRWVSADMAADYAKGQALTLEAYTAGYEAYRAGLMDSTISLPVGILVAGIMITGLFAVYEVLGALLGTLISRMAPTEPRAPNPGP
jgi:hypothetical protein